jgi:hypothetical protein
MRESHAMQQHDHEDESQYETSTGQWRGHETTANLAMIDLIHP